MKTIILLTCVFFISMNLSAKREWILKHGRMYEDIRSIQCINDFDCYALIDSVSRTIIYGTNNAGHSWEMIFRGTHFDDWNSYYIPFEGLFLDTTNMYISYLYKTVLEKSTDGGKTFQRRFFTDSTVEDNQNIKSFDMYNSKIGAIHTTFKLCYTKDNWETFETVEYGSERLYYGAPVFFIDSNNIAVKKHKNGYGFEKYNIEEKKWSEYSLASPLSDSLVPHDDRKKIRTLCFVNDTVGYACGSQIYNVGNFRKEIVWKTTNRGKEWVIVLERFNEENPLLGLTHIAFANEQHGIAVGSWGRVVETTDGGDTWEYLELPEEARSTLGMKVAWAGEYAIVGSNKGGIYRLEETGDTTNVPIIMSKNILVRQRKDDLLIVVADSNYRKYEIYIYDLQGNLRQRNELNSGRSKIYQPINISSLNTGMYLFRISVKGQSVQTGKFVIDR